MARASTRWRAISESLEYELGDTRIRVTLMEPDGMQTSIGFHHSSCRTRDPHREAPALLRQLEINTREQESNPALWLKKSQA